MSELTTCTICKHTFDARNSSWELYGATYACADCIASNPEGINEELETTLAKVYPSIGLNADWSSTAYQLTPNAVLIDTEVDDEWNIVCYWTNDDGEKQFNDGDGICWAGTLPEAVELLSELEDCGWNRDGDTSADSNAVIDAYNRAANTVL